MHLNNGKTGGKGLIQKGAEIILLRVKDVHADLAIPLLGI